MEPVVVVSGAPGADRDLADPCPPGSFGEVAPEIHPCSPAGPRPTERVHDLRSHLITSTTNPYAAMHCNLSSGTVRCLAQRLDTPLQDPGGRAAPPRVQQGDGSRRWVDEIDGNTICHGHGEQHAGVPREVAVDSVADPALAIERVVHRDLDPVVLPAHRDPLEPADDRRQSLQAIGPFRSRLLRSRGESEIGLPTGHAGHDAEPPPPSLQLIAREGRVIDACLALEARWVLVQRPPTSARSIFAPKAANRRSIAS